MYFGLEFGRKVEAVGGFEVEEELGVGIESSGFELEASCKMVGSDGVVTPETG